MKTALGFLVAFAIGIVCRLADVPLPAPPVLIGALLVATMTVGYAVTDRFMARRAGAQRALSGEPTGDVAAPRDKAP